MAYCDSADVKQLLPSAYNATKLTDPIIDEKIAEGDDKLDALLQSQYFPFNAHGSTPATPGIIKEASRNVAAGLCYRILGTFHSTDLTTRGKELMDMGFADAASLLEDGVQLPPEIKTGETLTFGASDREDWEIDQYEAILASTSPLDSGDPPNILKDGLRLTTVTSVDNPGQFRYGRDFDVYFDGERGVWIFHSNRSEIYGAATVTVKYPWDYRRLYADSDRHNGGLVYG